MGPLAEALLDALPQTQCTRCGYPDCRGYAEAIADGRAAINRCPPGGREGVQRLARITGRSAEPLDPACGTEGPRALAVIDEAACIGCALCLAACPVDAIVGAAKHMHTVVDALCTGCELCLPACPVDCIALVNASGERSGWSAWGAAEADRARMRYAGHRHRLDARAAPAAEPVGASTAPSTTESPSPTSAIVAAAIARARAERSSR